MLTKENIIWKKTIGWEKGNSARSADININATFLFSM